TGTAQIALPYGLSRARKPLPSGGDVSVTPSPKSIVPANPPSTIGIPTPSTAMRGRSPPGPRAFAHCVTNGAAPPLPPPPSPPDPVPPYDGESPHPPAPGAPPLAPPNDDAVPEEEVVLPSGTITLLQATSRAAANEARRRRFMDASI